LGRLDMREFDTLFIRGDIIAVTYVEKIPLHGRPNTSNS
jgi:hypothetical protein